MRFHRPYHSHAVEQRLGDGLPERPQRPLLLHSDVTIGDDEGLEEEELLSPYSQVLHSVGSADALEEEREEINMRERKEKKTLNRNFRLLRAESDSIALKKGEKRLFSVLT